MLTSLSKSRRSLPDEWVHRTPQGTAHGPLVLLHGGLSSPLTRATLRRALDVLTVLTRSDFSARYRAQALGVVWSVLYPLVMMAIMSLIFTRVFRSTTEHFSIFLLMGLVFWQWAQNAISAATGVFVNNADVIKRTVFARHLLPVAAVLSYGINFCIESVTLLVFIPIFPGAFRLSPALLCVPVLLLLAVLLVTGISLATSVLNVIYRDVAYMVNTGLLLLYWLTPVIYPIEVIPQPYQKLLLLNPLGGLLTALRRAVMLGQAPTLLGWVGLVVPTLLVLGLGWLIFRHYERMVLDYV